MVYLSRFIHEILSSIYKLYPKGLYLIFACVLKEYYAGVSVNSLNFTLKTGCAFVCVALFDGGGGGSGE